LATASAGAVQNLVQLAGARALLGAASREYFPRNARASALVSTGASRIFDELEFAVHRGRRDSGPAGGGVPDAALELAQRVCGARIFGLVLAVAWWFADQPEEKNAAEQEDRAATSWRIVLGDRRFRGLFIARIVTTGVVFLSVLDSRVHAGKSGALADRAWCGGWIPSAVAAVVGIISARWTDRAAARSADPSGCEFDS